MVERFQRKKELLARRDLILEKIGRDVYEADHLPTDFQHLPQEFSEVDKIVQQIEERIGPLAQELERLTAQQPALTQKLKQMDLKKKNDLSPLVSEHQEVSQLLVTQGDSSPALSSEQKQTMETRIQEINNAMEALKKKYAQTRKELKQQLELSEKKCDRLRSEIQKHKDEEEQLNERKTNLLRDLGFEYFKNRSEDSHFTAKYGQIDLIQQELSELQYQTQITDAKPEPVAKKSIGRVAVPVLIIILAFSGFLLFRTTFKTLSASSLEMLSMVPASRNQVTIFARQQHIQLLGQKLGGLQELPGAPFNLNGWTGVKNAFVCMTHKDSELLAAGIVLNQATKIGPDLRKKNWTSRSMEQGFEVWSNGVWSWIVLGSGRFLLVKTGQVEQISWSPQPANPELQTLFETPIPQVGPNNAVLFGADHVRIEQLPGGLNFTFSSAEPFPDLAFRQQFLDSRASLPEDVGAVSMAKDIRFQGVKGSLNKLDLPAIESQIFALAEKLRRAPKVKTKLGLPPLTAPISGAEEAWIMAFSVRDQPTLINAVQLGKSIRHLVFNPNQSSLLVADSSQQVVRKVKYLDGEFFQDGSHTFENQQPSTLALDPEGRFCAVLDAVEIRGRQPFIALLDTQTMEKTWQQPLSKEVIGATCGVWDQAGKTLYVGVSSRHEGSRRGVMVFLREGNQLRLSRFFDLPQDRDALAAIGSLKIRENHLFATNMVDGSLMRFNLDQSSPLPSERVFLFNRMESRTRPVFHHDSSLMALNRQKNHFIALQSSDLANRKYGSAAMLIDLDAENPVLQQTLALGNMVFSMAREPLTNSFWISEYRDRSLVQVRLIEDELVLEQRLKFDNHALQQLVFDTFGDVLFASAISR